jgi:hypothetical protein
MRTAVVFALSAALFLAGCAGNAATPKAAGPSTSAAVATVSSSTAETATVRGRVLTEDQLAIPGATVGLTQLNTQLQTGPAGEFEFQKVPFGKVDLVVQKLGYDSVAKRIDVTPADMPVVTVVLKALAVSEAYVEVQPHKALHHLGATQYAAWAFNLTGDGSAMCSACVWFIRDSVTPDKMVIEDLGKHTVANPQGDQDYFWVFQNHYSSNVQAGGSLLMKLPHGSGSIEKDKLGSKVKVWWAQVLCDTNWFCFEEPREFYVSLFHGQEPGDKYTAAPPA